MNQNTEPMTDADRGQVRAEAAEVYEAFFVPALFGQFTEPVLDHASVEEGDRVLDVGCGTGILARAARRRVGATGRVAGIDSNEGMVAVAHRTDGSVDWHVGMAEELPFEAGDFDRTASQFAAMFFVDCGAALEEMARVTRPSGTVTTATWSRMEPSNSARGNAGSQRAAAAFLAISDRSLGVNFLARAFPPFEALDSSSSELLVSLLMLACIEKRMLAWVSPIIATQESIARENSQASNKN
jgi:SAM-dependent methyltransferase